MISDTSSNNNKKGFLFSWKQSTNTIGKTLQVEGDQNILRLGFMCSLKNNNFFLLLSQPMFHYIKICNIESTKEIFCVAFFKRMPPIDSMLGTQG